MKLYFKLLILITLIFLTSIQLDAREVIIINHNSRLNEAKLTKKTIIKQFNIPKSFIVIINKPLECKNKLNKKPLLYICISKRNTLYTKLIRRNKLKRLIKMFKKIKIEESENVQSQI